MSEDINSHMQVVLEHFCHNRDKTQAQINELLARLKEQNNTIASLSRELYGDGAPVFTKQTSNRYATISVRWAILDLLSGSGALTSADIADILKREGVTTKAANFQNNISAVLSTTMKTGAQEVQQTLDGKWELTEKGKNAAFHIRSSTKFRRSVPAMYTATASNGFKGGDGV
jgi:pyridoxal/pyridoxine/pyridoxamine kinase